MNIEELNEIYKKLEQKATELYAPFCKIHNVFNYKIAYYSGHYSKNKDGIYQMDYYPIPVIEIKDFCDIEVGLDKIIISTKLKRDKALIFDYNKISKYNFEVYGVKEYTTDYFIKGDTIDNLLSNIKSSNEKEIGYSFIFEYDLKGDELYKFVLFLRKNEFYY